MMKITERRNYSLVKLSAEIGGIVRVLTLTFQFLTFMFMRHRFTALFANRMYKYSDEVFKEIDF